MVVDRLTLFAILINIEEVVSALPIDRAVRIKGRRDTFRGHNVITGSKMIAQELFPELSGRGD